MLKLGGEVAAPATKSPQGPPDSQENTVLPDPVSSRSHFLKLLKNILNCFLVYVCMCMMCGGGIHAMLYMWRSESNFVVFVLSFAFARVPEFGVITTWGCHDYIAMALTH